MFSQIEEFVTQALRAEEIRLLCRGLHESMLTSMEHCAPIEIVAGM
jgi:hypothetical protein